MAVQTLAEGWELPVHNQGTSQSHSFIKVLSGSIRVTLFEWPDVLGPSAPMVLKENNVYNQDSVVYLNGKTICSLTN